MIKNIIKKFLDRFLKDYDLKTYNIHLIDKKNQRISLADEILNLHSRIRYLEKENVCMSNAMYEMENRIQSQIDKINTPVLNLGDFNLGE